MCICVCTKMQCTGVLELDAVGEGGGAKSGSCAGPQCEGLKF